MKTTYLKHLVDYYVVFPFILLIHLFKKETKHKNNHVK